VTGIAIIGEALLELSHTPGSEDRRNTDRQISDSQGRDRLGYGGDTLNSAVYLARLGLSPNFISALGIDPYSDHLLQQWKKEGVQVDHVLRHPTRLPGLYAIRTDHAGERHFYYWREMSAARAFFELAGAKDALTAAQDARWLYLSGITLSIFDDGGRAALGAVAASVKARGGEVVFDPNYRPRGWADHDAARRAMADIAGHVTLALPTIEDEDALFGPAGRAAHAARWTGWGARQVVLKDGAQGAILFGETGGQEGIHVPVETAVTPVDTTGAGDSFNAAFIGARILGHDALAAARAGNHLAGTVVQHRGAIIPHGAMPPMKWFGEREIP